MIKNTNEQKYDESIYSTKNTGPPTEITSLLAFWVQVHRLHRMLDVLCGGLVTDGGNASFAKNLGRVNENANGNESLLHYPKAFALCLEPPEGSKDQKLLLGMHLELEEAIG
jgi:hypothetical protein